MRTLTGHRIPTLDDKGEPTGQFMRESNADVQIVVYDDDDIRWSPTKRSSTCHYSLAVKQGDFSQVSAAIRFHKADPKRTDEFGQPCPTPTNGITVEALLTVCLDKLRVHQAGRFPNELNALAIVSIEEALHHLQSRTKNRIERNVEGLQLQSSNRKDHGDE